MGLKDDFVEYLGDSGLEIDQDVDVRSQGNDPTLRILNEIERYIRFMPRRPDAVAGPYQRAVEGIFSNNPQLYEHAEAIFDRVFKPYTKDIDHQVIDKVKQNVLSEARKREAEKQQQEAAERERQEEVRRAANPPKRDRASGAGLSTEDVKNALRSDSKIGGKPALEWILESSATPEDKTKWTEFAINNDCKINGKPTLQYILSGAKESDKANWIKNTINASAKIDGQHVLEWLYDDKNTQSREVMGEIMDYCIANDIHVNGKPYAQWIEDKLGVNFAVEEAIKIGSNIAGKPALEWAIDNNQQIAGKPALEWALGNDKVTNESLLDGIVYSISIDLDVGGRPALEVIEESLYSKGGYQGELLEQAIGAGVTVGGGPALEWAITNDRQIGGKSALEWAMKEEIEVEGKSALEWAALNDKQIAGKSALQYAVENDLKIAGKPALEWAMENDKQIAGKHPLEWALDNKGIVNSDSLVAGMHHAIGNDMTINGRPALEVLEESLYAGGGYKGELLGQAIGAGVTVGGSPVLEWAVENGKKIDGKPALEWAVIENKQIDGKPALEWAVENGKKIDGKPALEWAVIENKNIQGKPALEYAVENGHITQKKATTIAVNNNLMVGDKPGVEWAIDKGIIKEKDAMLYVVQNNINVGDKVGAQWVINKGADPVAVVKTARKAGVDIGDQLPRDWARDNDIDLGQHTARVNGRGDQQQREASPTRG